MRSVFAHGERIADLSAYAGRLHLDLGFDREGKTRFDDHVPVFDLGSRADPRAVLSKPIGMDEHAAPFAAAASGEPDKLIEQFADSLSRSNPIDQMQVGVNRYIHRRAVLVGVFRSNQNRMV